MLVGQKGTAFSRYLIREGGVTHFGPQVSKTEGFGKAYFSGRFSSLSSSKSAKWGFLWGESRAFFSRGQKGMGFSPKFRPETLSKQKFFGRKTEIGVFGGFGVSSKRPSFRHFYHLYPFKAYFPLRMHAFRAFISSRNRWSVDLPIVGRYVGLEADSLDLLSLGQIYEPFIKGSMGHFQENMLEEICLYFDGAHFLVKKGLFLGFYPYGGRFYRISPLHN